MAAVIAIKQINMCRVDDVRFADLAAVTGTDYLRFRRLVTSHQYNCDCPYHVSRTYIRPDGYIYETISHTALEQEQA